MTRSGENESVFDHSEVKKSLSECLEGLKSALTSVSRCLEVFDLVLSKKNRKYSLLKPKSEHENLLGRVKRVRF